MPKGKTKCAECGKETPSIYGKLCLECKKKKEHEIPAAEQN